MLHPPLGVEPGANAPQASLYLCLWPLGQIGLKSPALEAVGGDTTDFPLLLILVFCFGSAASKTGSAVEANTHGNGNHKLSGMYGCK